MGAMIDILNQVEADQVGEQIQALQRINRTLQKGSDIGRDGTVELTTRIDNPPKRCIGIVALLLVSVGAIALEALPGIIYDACEIAERPIVVMKKRTQLLSDKGASFRKILGPG